MYQVNITNEYGFEVEPYTHEIPTRAGAVALAETLVTKGDPWGTVYRGAVVRVDVPHTLMGGTMPLHRTGNAV